MSVTEKQVRTIKVGPIAISDESLDSMLEQAGYGCAYWASAASVDKTAGTYTIQEQEEEEVHTITFQKLHETFWGVVNREYKVGFQVQQYFDNAVIDGASAGQGDIDAGHIDSDAADVLIQLAAFGEIVYG